MARPSTLHLIAFVGVGLCQPGVDALQTLRPRGAPICRHRTPSDALTGAFTALRERARQRDEAPVQTIKEYEDMVEYCVESGVDTFDCVSAAASLDVAAAKTRKRMLSKFAAEREGAGAAALPPLRALDYVAFTILLVLLYADLLDVDGVSRFL